MLFQKISLFLILGSLIAGLSSHGLAQECGTVYQPDPHFDRNEYETFLREFSHDKVTRDVVLLPIQFNIVRHTDGTGGLDPALLEEILDTANVHFLPAGIQFYACGQTRFIDENFLFDFDRALFQDSLEARTTSNAINVFFINKVLNDDNFLCGYANFPWVDDTHVVVKNSCAVNGKCVLPRIGALFWPTPYSRNGQRHRSG